MRLAVMQPYFFPYIGYWQLIHAADCFVLFDDAQYMRHGWINRNRILKPGGGWQYIIVPLGKHSMTESIKNVRAHPDQRWKELIIAQLAHYKKRAQFFVETNDIVRNILFGNADRSIVAINLSAIKQLCTHLGITSEVLVASEQNFDYSRVGGAAEWSLRIAEQLGASEYVNPVGGAELFNLENSWSGSIKLSFLKSQEITYSQQGAFEPSLSIIDVLMFNGIKGTKALLQHYSIETRSK